MKLKKILKAVSKVTDLSIEAIKANNRKRELVQARNIYYYIARLKTNNSLETISELVDKNHATISSNLKKFDYDIELNYMNSAKLLKKCKRKLKESKIKTPIFKDISQLLIKEKNILKL